MEYKYITENNLENKQTYMYSEFGGAEFLKAYKNSRLGYLERVMHDEVDSKVFHCTRSDLLRIKDNIKDEKSNQINELLNNYVKRFEVCKRLYTVYDYNWKIAENAPYNQYDLYILLADCCIRAYENTKCTKYFSCLLKISDTLLSIEDKLTEIEKRALGDVIEKEIMEFDKLSNQIGVAL